MTARVADFVPAYHNSGPMPNNAYRTGAVGVQVDMSSNFIVSTLLETVKLTHLLAGRSQGYAPRLHPALIHGAVCSALVQLNASAAVTRSSKEAIKALSDNGLPQRAPATRSNARATRTHWAAPIFPEALRVQREQRVRRGAAS
jgi:hypothetical protein